MSGDGLAVTNMPLRWEVQELIAGGRWRLVAAVALNVDADNFKRMLAQQMPDGMYRVRERAAS